jgi:hypothetical protein
VSTLPSPLSNCTNSFSLLYITVFVIFLCTEEAVQRVKCEKTAEQAVLKVEVKTEIEEDRDPFEHKVRDSFFYFADSDLKRVFSP